MNEKAKRSLEEERKLLIENGEDYEKYSRISYLVFETAVAKGAAKNIGKWPSHLFAAFLAASLVFAAFIIFALVIALFCIPTMSYKCRNSRNSVFPEYPNVYYVKTASYTWSRDELCYVEQSARDNPEINIYLINLLNGSQPSNKFSDVKILKNKKNEEFTEMLIIWEEANNSIDTTIDLSSNATTETRIRRRLASHYSNVRNIDVTIEEFFKGSMLSRVSQKLDLESLQIAAKAYLLWNSSGIALSPLEYRHLKYLQEYLCRTECKTIKIASINKNGSIIASGVPCQAFIGNLIHAIVVNGVTKGRNFVKEAQESFCQRLQECPGLKILDEDSRLVSTSPSCSTIYPSGFPRQNSKN